MSHPVLRIATWNLEWATPTSRRGQLLTKELHRLAADVLCITESCKSMLPPNGYFIASAADYGYSAPPERRKVLLWSRNPWSNADILGSTELPSGRFIAGTTLTPLGPIRVFGVCIPWRDAHVRTGRRDRMPWQDHLSYLSTIPSVLARHDGVPALWLGDFNQRVPAQRTPVHVHSALERALQGWQVATAGEIAPVAQRSVDHIVHQSELEAIAVRGQSRFAADGTELSDHFGVMGEFRRST